MIPCGPGSAMPRFFPVLRVFEGKRLRNCQAGPESEWWEEIPGFLFVRRTAEIAKDRLHDLALATLSSGKFVLKDDIVPATGRIGLVKSDCPYVS